MVFKHYFNRFYTDRKDSVHPTTKWSTLTINEMEKIYMSIDLTRVLDEEYDIRKCRLEQISVPQLRKECDKENIQVPRGCKKDVLVRKLQQHLGEHTLVR